MPLSYRFGEVEVRPIERKLLVGGLPAAIGARAFDLLLALIEHRERLVSKNELLDIVWPGLVVEESNLHTQVSTLRKLLGAQAIATIPGRGYRFAAALDAGGEALPATDSPVAAPARSGETPDALDPLPAMAAPLLGRDEELGALDDMLRRHRLVTLVGAGGIGKTALALAAAHASMKTRRIGTCWVDLTSIGSPSLVAATVAQTLHLPIGRGDASLLALIAGLRSMQVLIVIDNAEHLVEAVARIAEKVMAEAAGVRLLVTSQVPLQVQGERLFRLGALAIPADDTPSDQSLTYGSVAVFVDQCQAVDRRFELNDANAGGIIRVCRQLDGSPLAIKLAAARLPSLGLRTLEARLRTPLRLLVGNNGHAPKRQSTLVAALDWSHALLSAREQAVFRRFAVFVGGFTLELATAVASDETNDEWEVIDSLAVLVDRSLVAVDAGERPRYRMLDSVREYAMRHLLEASELLATQHRHAYAMTQLFENADEAVWSMADTPWLAIYAPELGNVRSAMDWCMQHDVLLAVSLTGGAAGLFILLGLLHEFRRRSEALEPRLSSELPPQVLARYWTTRSACLWGVDHRSMLECALRAEKLYRALGDARGLCISLVCATTSWLLAADKSDKVLEELAQLDRPDWPPRLRAWIKDATFQALYSAGRFEELRSAANQMLAWQVRPGANHGEPALDYWIGNWLVVAELELGNVDRAVRMARDVVRDQGKLNAHHVTHVYALSNLARGLLKQGELGDARQALSMLFDCCRISGWHVFGIFSDLNTLLALRERRWRTAAKLLGYSDAAQSRIGRRSDTRTGFGARAHASLQAELGASSLEELIVLGAQLNEEAVCTLTLASA